MSLLVFVDREFDPEIQHVSPPLEQNSAWISVLPTNINRDSRRNKFQQTNSGFKIMKMILLRLEGYFAIGKGTFLRAMLMQVTQKYHLLK